MHTYKFRKIYYNENNVTQIFIWSSKSRDLTVTMSQCSCPHLAHTPPKVMNPRTRRQPSWTFLTNDSRDPVNCPLQFRVAPDTFPGHIYIIKSQKSGKIKPFSPSAGEPAYEVVYSKVQKVNVLLTPVQDMTSCDPSQKSNFQPYDSSRL